MSKVNKFIRRARMESTPLVDDGRVTFVWQGTQAPVLVGDFTDWERGQPVELTQVARDTWVHSRSFSSDAYIEYAFLDRQNLKERYPDPFNKQIIFNGIGDYNNYFYMPDAAPTHLVEKIREVPSGLVTRHTVDTWGLVNGKTRSVYLYQPPSKEPCSLLVVWDGRDYFRRAHLNVILDNLIAQKRIRPLALAMVNHGGQARVAEYGCSDGTLAFLLYKVLPLAQQNLNLTDIATQPGDYAVMGASMGGLMALYTGLRLPGIFGHVLSQSGAFSMGTFDTILFDLVEKSPSNPPKIWLDVGLYDIQNLLVANRRMFARLSERNYQLEYREYPAGHNYTAWRNGLWRGLEWHYGV